MGREDKSDISRMRSRSQKGLRAERSDRRGGSGAAPCHTTRRGQRATAALSARTVPFVYAVPASDMTIATVLVTGANRGLGLEFIKLLVKQIPAPRVIVATCRDPSKAQVRYFDRHWTHYRYRPLLTNLPNLFMFALRCFFFDRTCNHWLKRIQTSALSNST